MQQLLSRLSLATLLLAGLAGCQKTEVAPRELVTCSYQVLNAKGEETTVFTQGQEIFFRYSIANNSDQPILLQGDVFDYPRFMEVFEEQSGVLLPLGKPYASIAQLYVRYVEVAPHQHLSYTFSWTESVPSPDVAYYTAAPHAPLLPGSYRTSMVPRLIWHHPAGPETTLPVAAQDFVRRFAVR